MSEVEATATGGDVVVTSDSPPTEAPASQPTSPEPAQPTETARDISRQAIEDVKKAQADTKPVEVAPAEPTTPDTPAEETKPRPFRLSRDGKDYDVKGLEGVKFHYKASGEEVEADLDNLVRKAQQAHGMTDRLEELRAQRQDLFQENQGLVEKVQSLQGDRDLLLAALKDETGNTFKQLQSKFLGKEGSDLLEEPQPQEQPQSEDEFVKQYGQPREVFEAGLRAVEDHILPWANRVGEAYGGVDGEEIVKVALEELNKVPEKYRSFDVLGEILNELIPSMLADEGFEMSAEFTPFDVGVFQGKPASRFAKREAPKSDVEKRLEALEAENQQLKEKLEGTSPATVREKLEDAPPGGGSRGGVSRSSGPAGVTLDLSQANTKEEIREAVRKLRQA